MKVTERVAYLKGLYEGLGMDGDKKEGKLLKEVIEVLAELAQTSTQLQEQTDVLVDDVDELYDEFFAMQGGEEDACEHHEDDMLYQLVCPTCNEKLFIDEEALEAGSMQCPACGEDLEFDLSEIYSADEDEDELLEDI